MYASARHTAASVLNGKTAFKFSEPLQFILNDSQVSSARICSSCVAIKQAPNPKRHFSATSRAQLKEYFPPPKDTPNIKITGPAWHHPMYVSFPVLSRMCQKLAVPSSSAIPVADGLAGTRKTIWSPSHQPTARPKVGATE